MSHLVRYQEIASASSISILGVGRNNYWVFAMPSPELPYPEVVWLWGKESLALKEGHGLCVSTHVCTGTCIWIFSDSHPLAFLWFVPSGLAPDSLLRLAWWCRKSPEASCFTSSKFGIFWTWRHAPFSKGQATHPSLAHKNRWNRNLAEVLVYFVRDWSLALASREDYL